MNKTISVGIPTDDRGLVGRECPSCGGYFKVKFGTGLKVSYQICPYCNHKDEGNKFVTKQQVGLMQSTIANKIVAPMLNEFSQSLKKLESRSRYGSVKVTTDTISYPIKSYQERILETDVTCNNCGLEFSIYGVFSNCPDCGMLNAKVIFVKNIDLNLVKLSLSTSDSISSDMSKELIKSALIDSVSIFDSLGKALKEKYPDKFFSKPKNLFQNINKLNSSLIQHFNKGIDDLLTLQESELLKKMFQVRHVYIHSAGVVDSDFVEKLPEFSFMKGKIYKLNDEETKLFIKHLKKLGEALYELVEGNK